MDERVLLDTKAAAKRLGLSASTLEKLRVYGGGPPYCKLQRSVRYRYADLTRWIEDRVRSNTSAPNAPANAGGHNP